MLWLTTSRQRSEFFILYTGWWSFEVRNELWQIIVRTSLPPFLCLCFAAI